MKARNDENLEGIQGLARGLGRLLPRGGARGEAIAELQARAEREITEVSESLQAESNDNYEEWQKAEATLAAVREECDDADEKAGRVVTGRIRAILDGEGE